MKTDFSLIIDNTLRFLDAQEQQQQDILYQPDLKELVKGLCSLKTNEVPEVFNVALEKIYDKTLKSLDSAAQNLNGPKPNKVSKLVSTGGMTYDAGLSFLSRYLREWEKFKTITHWLSVAFSPFGVALSNSLPFEYFSSVYLCFVSDIKRIIMKHIREARGQVAIVDENRDLIKKGIEAIRELNPKLFDELKHAIAQECGTDYKSSATTKLGLNIEKDLLEVCSCFGVDLGCNIKLLERTIVSELSKQGHLLSCNIGKMIDDLDESKKDTDNFYSSMERDRLLASGVDLTVTNLKAGTWRVLQQHPNLTPPREMMGPRVVCEEFLEKANATDTYKTSALYTEGRCLIDVDFETATIELDMLPIQAAVLLLFNNKQSLRFTEIMNMLNLDKSTLTRVLGSMSCNMCEILRKTTEEEEEDCYMLNCKFQSHTGKCFEVPRP